MTFIIIMMMNVINEQAASARDEDAVALVEYSFNAPNGEPEGCEFAESFEEAAQLWGYSLQNGECRLMQVWGPSDARWYRIERTRDGVEAREVAV